MPEVVKLILALIALTAVIALNLWLYRRFHKDRPQTPGVMASMVAPQLAKQAADKLAAEQAQKAAANAGPDDSQDAPPA
jgi:hypothetical protein